MEHVGPYEALAEAQAYRNKMRHPSRWRMMFYGVDSESKWYLRCDGVVLHYCPRDGYYVRLDHVPDWMWRAGQRARTPQAAVDAAIRCASRYAAKMMRLSVSARRRAGGA
jgi:hypothetical protein